MRVPWTASKTNQSILKEISPEYSLERLMLKLQYFGYLMQRADSLEKTLKLGKTEGVRRGQWKTRWLDCIINSTDMSFNKLWDMMKEKEAWRVAGSPWGHKELDMTERLNNNRNTIHKNKLQMN